ncbi:MAG: hypothetical protein JST89_04085 [Cyanobacteria bacterium SZAS-4]|nr:hypothetical protein [Cyanobacteria bacterium SZAS-4]
MTDHNIAGEWLGHYRYDKHPTPGGGFTAFFSETGGAIHGSIVDDGGAGKATLTGTFSFPDIRFTKLYVRPTQNKSTKSEKTFTPKFQIGFGKFGIGIGKENTVTTTTTETFGNPVEYEGTMSHDGKSMSGTWKIQGPNISNSGTWSASRLKEDDVQDQIKINAVRTKEREKEETV